MTTEMFPRNTLKDWKLGSRTVMGSILLAITALGAVLCFHDLGAKPLWFDEGWSLGCAQLPPRDSLILAAYEPVQWPYYLVLRVWLSLGDSEALIRMPSALFMIASIPMMFLVARRLFGTTAGLVSALLLAINADIVKYAHEARSYGMEIFLLITSLYLLWEYVERPSPCRAAAYVAICVLAIYTHLYGALVVAAQALSMLVLLPSGFPRKHWLFTFSSIGILTIPMWVFATRVPPQFTVWMGPPGWTTVYTVLQHVCGNAGGFLVFLCALLCVIAFLGALSRLRSGETQAAWSRVLSLLCLFLPIVLTLIVSYLGRPCFWGRYMLLCVPGLVLTIGGTASHLYRQWMTAPLLGIFLALGLLGVRSYYRTDFDIDTKVRENYPQLAAYIAQNALPGDGVLLYWPGMRVNYEYYLSRLPNTPFAPTVIYPTRARGRENFQLIPSTWFPPEAPPPHLHGYRRVWFVVHRFAIDYRDPYAIGIASAIQAEYPNVSFRVFPTWTVGLYSSGYDPEPNSATRP